MSVLQRVVPVRRTYNRWVANQTLEDFALRFTAKRARRWSLGRVANTALGGISFLALEAIGGAITLGYGFTNAALAILAVGLLIFATGLPISYYAARFGVDVDLLTRGAGFGYIGSTVTSLIYASFTFLFLAIEAAIMATALEMCFGIPLAAGYVVSSLLVIPLVAYGITFISRFQRWSQPVWIALQALPFLFIAMQDRDAFEDWTGFAGADGTAGGFDVLLFGAAASVVLSFVAQVGEQADFLRFLPPPQDGRRWRWWAALLAAGPGWIVIGAVKMLIGSFLAVFALGHMVAPEQAAEPTQMYLIAFRDIVASPQLAVALTGLFVVLSQVKINLTNTYAGSIAWSNFFSRLTHSHPGRVVWVVFNVAIALLLMELGIYRTLEPILGFYANVAASWVGALVADLVVNKPLGLSPPHIEFKRAHLYDINPVGTGAMMLASLVSVTAFMGSFGPVLQVLAPFVALGVAFMAAPLLAWATGGRYYIARTSPAAEQGARCIVCEHEFEGEDMAHCPVYAGPICSLCCSLDARCADGCKPQARLSAQILAALAAVLPADMVGTLNARLGHYLGIVLIQALVVGAMLALVHVQVVHAHPDARAVIAGTLWKVFFILMIVVGVASWLFVLTRESRRVAQEESDKQTSLLMQEIEAHKQTDAQLQKAKEAAEAANLAKSRYLVGISHEFRTPLNAIFGYAQLLERDPTIPERRHDAVRVIRRSAEHLSGLIEGLLDISKIEGGRLQLNRSGVRVADLLDQLVDMFRLQAAAKGIDFHFSRADNLPVVVHTDESRLRQIFINLLSNAIKFTESGHVTLRVRYRSQIAEFEVEDTGPGIPPEEIGRIFEPFARGAAAEEAMIPGMGLGLTITKLLTEVLGGGISVSSEPGRGSTFKVKLMMSEATHSDTAAAVPDTLIRGYTGRRRTILVTDDDPAHRGLMQDVLSALGFTVFTAGNGDGALRLAARSAPDAFLLDISMPGMSGWEVARALRAAGHRTQPIIMVSANARENRPVEAPDAPYDGFVAKPVDVGRLLATLRQLLALEWEYDAAPAPALAAAPSFASSELPPRQHLADLLHLGRIGYIRGIQSKLADIEAAHPEHRPFVIRMRALVAGFALNQYMAVLEAVYHDER
ncbi:MAG TPA: ATP-binding protein [Azospirillum sp.]|nr:ATP-binding protein [Azospirillum sp.]